MPKRFAGFVIAFCLCFVASAAQAGESSPGAGMQGLSLQLGYDASYLYYVERTAPNNRQLDKDSGWMQGGFAEARYDFPAAFARLRFDAMGSGSATYDGALLNGTPLTMSTREYIYKTEFDLGYKLYDQDQATFSPYIGIGYRDWKRGQDTAPSYVEYYTWWYGALGVNHMFRTGKWLLGIDAAVLYPFSMKMETNMRGLYDKTKFNIQPLPGLRVELPVSYEIYASENMKMSVFAIPFYEKWDIAKSPTVAMKRGGVLTGDHFYEPNSSTDITGLKVGLGVNF